VAGGVLLLLLLRTLLAPTVIVVDHGDSGTSRRTMSDEDRSLNMTRQPALGENPRPPRREGNDPSAIQPGKEPAYAEFRQPKPEAAAPNASKPTSEQKQPPLPEQQLRQSVYLIQLEKYNELLPFATCCAITENTLITTAREAAQLVRWRKSDTFHRVWISDETGTVRREVEGIRAHCMFVKLAQDGDRQRWIYFDFALLTVEDKLPTFVPLASKDELKELESGLSLTCLGFSHDGKKITKHNRPKLQNGKHNCIYTITTSPASADVPGPTEPARLLHIDGEIPHESMETPQSGNKVVMPAYGSPIFNRQGRLVAVYGATMEPTKGQELLAFHYAPVINPNWINLWLQKEDTKTWPVPDVLPATLETSRPQGDLPSLQNLNREGHASERWPSLPPDRTPRRVFAAAKLLSLLSEKTPG
jgi:hypothetical protein